MNFPVSGVSRPDSNYDDYQGNCFPFFVLKDMVIYMDKEWLHWKPVCGCNICFGELDQFRVDITPFDPFSAKII